MSTNSITKGSVVRHKNSGREYVVRSEVYTTVHGSTVFEAEIISLKTGKPARGIVYLSPSDIANA